MKIIVLGTRGFPDIQGGVEMHCQQLYPELVRLGCEVTVLAREPYVGKQVKFYQGVQVVPISCFKNKFLEAFGHTFKGIFAARRMGCDILHIHAVGPSLFIPLARFLGLKVVMTNHGPDYQRKKWGKTAKAALKLGEYLGSIWANQIICISRTIAENIKNQYGKEAKVIPNGVVLPQVLESNGALKKYGLAGKKYILSVGRYVPEKGFHDLVKAFNELQIENYKLVIVGRADHEDRYSLYLINEASKNANIVLCGFLSGEPLQELYSHAGLFVLPSYYEGLPIVLLEAMSYGLSCLVSDIPANREAGLSEDRFFLPGDARALALKIKEFKDKPLSNEEKKEQRGRVSQRYNWENIVKKTLEVYNLVILPRQKSLQN